MPENVMTDGQPNSAAAVTAAAIFSVQKSQLALSFQPFTKPWLPAIAQVRPCFLRIGQSVGAINSTDLSPIAVACIANCSTDIGLKHQCTTDCLMRPLATFHAASS